MAETNNTFIDDTVFKDIIEHSPLVSLDLVIKNYNAPKKPNHLIWFSYSKGYVRTKGWHTIPLIEIIPSSRSGVRSFSLSSNRIHPR